MGDRKALKNQKNRVAPDGRSNRGVRIVTEMSIVRLEPKREDYEPGTAAGFIAYHRDICAWRDMRAAVGAKLFDEAFRHAMKKK